MPHIHLLNSLAVWLGVSGISLTMSLQVSGLLSFRHTGIVALSTKGVRSLTMDLKLLQLKTKLEEEEELSHYILRQNLTRIAEL